MKKLYEFKRNKDGHFEHELYGSFSATEVGEYIVLSEKSSFLSYCDIPEQFKIVRMDHHAFHVEFKDRTVEALLAMILRGDARIVR